MKVLQEKKLLGVLAENELKKLKLTERANEVGLRQVFDWNGSYSDSISIEDSLKLTIKAVAGRFTWL